ncbi:DUF397 domain-containing protein [Actinophytocola xanthii]|uniref:DUF397 domain-containing protein n=1 Tax=Actinophytocola xanthii TaxID=1912961 RepID=A0A1Q8CND3_9PSEU|nr:DUF397 domain-containing protein [Actinophytocola xanthii]OLF15865.1 hypothetical protein BU204_19290 [Actinophytocola xanthii]
MITPALRWRRSSRSGDTNCVEVSHNLDAVRDSKQPCIQLGVDTRRLLDAVKNGRFVR